MITRTIPELRDFANMAKHASRMLDDTIEEEHFSPTQMTYNFIIDGFIKEGALHSALASRLSF